jgi:ATP-dependent helicase HrpA
MKTLAVIEKLENSLVHVMQADTAWSRHRLAAVRNRLARGKKTDELLQKIVDRISASAERSRARRDSLPEPEYDDSLPITKHREEILTALVENQVIIVAGETGSGKTTQLPKLCLEAGRGTRGLVGCTQPRRIAARAMADRVAEELHSELGQAVGYQVRFHERVSPDSFIKFMTDGILLAETAHDRNLDAYDTIIIDEAHERSLNIDFLLGYVKQLLPRRPDLRVIITSATIDTEKFSRHFDDAPVIEVSGRGYPVDVIYQPIGESTADRDFSNRDLYRGIADAVGRLSGVDPRGDILVFLSGEREIREAMDYLVRQNLRHTEVLPLYARLSSAEQRRVFHPGKARRVILSTNVAETSLTVPRIRFVVDSGFARISRYAHRSRIQRLPIEPVSRASANQRMGRCGRLGPGTCVRLYSEEDFDLRPEFTEPEILRTSLASVILRMLTMGLGAVEEFPFIDRPAPRMINDAYHLLFELGAVDGNREPTPQGRQLARWPLDVRLGRMVLEGARQGCLEDLLVLAAALSIQDPRERPLDAQEAADEAHGRFADKKSDFVTLLKLWQYLREQRRQKTGNQFRKLCRREFLNWQRVLEWFDLVQQLRDQAREERLALHGGHGKYEQVHMALLSGLLSHVGQRHPEDPGYAGARNRNFHIFPGSGLFGRGPKWLMSAEIVETTKPYARINAVVQPVWIEKLAGHVLKRHYRDPHWSRRLGEVMAWEQVSLFGLVIVEKRRVKYAPVDANEARRIFILEALVRGELNTRAEFMRQNAELRGEIELLEQKRRSRDVLVDESVVFEFFDARLPPEVCSARTLERWLAEIGAGGRKTLLLSHRLLMRDDAGQAPAELYPDQFEAGGQALPLEYSFMPGDPADGVSVTVPLELLNMLESRRMQWLVPGLLREKIVALIKSLPKPLRRAFTPAPQFADAVLQHLPAREGQAMLTWLARVLHELTGVAISAGDFEESELPDYLRFRILIQDREGRELAVGRDLGQLQETFGQKAQRRFMDQQGRAWNRDGETAWNFGALPVTVETESGASAWPALVDQHAAVGLRLFDTSQEGAYSQLEGVRRLLAIQMQDKLRYLQKNHGIGNALLVKWSPFGSTTRLVQDLVWTSLCALADDRAIAVRDAAAFEDLVQRGRKDIGMEFQRQSACLAEVLEKAGAVAVLLDGSLEQRRSAVFADMDSQLADMVYEGFLLDLDPVRFKHYPRYLEAMRVRLGRVEQNPVRDAGLMEQVAPYWRRYLDHINAGGLYDENLDSYRWLLEEFRVSLFAQHLGTAEKVSPKRLDAMWRKVLSGHD